LHGALPLDMSETTLRLALVDPFDVNIAEDLRFALGKDIHVVVSPPEQIEELIKQYYGTDTTSMEEVLSSSAKPVKRCNCARPTARLQLKRRRTRRR